MYPHSLGGTYLMNMIMDEGQERVLASYRDNYARLGHKAHYDPQNVFNVNQNILPAA